MNDMKILVFAGGVIGAEIEVDGIRSVLDVEQLDLLDNIYTLIELNEELPCECHDVAQWPEPFRLSDLDNELLWEGDD